MVEKDPNTEGLRAQAAVLLSQARAEMLDIQRALGTTAGNGSARERLAAAAAQVGGAIARLSGAMNSPSGSLQASDLTALESAVQSADIGSLAAEASVPGSVTPATATATANLAAASAAERADVQGLSQDVFERHIFDRYLHFSSAQDEAAFRLHEATVKKYVAVQLARNTPEGNLNAGGGIASYMLDADAHGAGASPDFLPRWNRLVADTTREHVALRAAGQSTVEFDRNVMASVRGFLKAKGLSDAEIDERLAGGTNPLDAVKPFLKDDADSRTLENQMGSGTQSAASAQPSPRGRATEGALPRDAQLSINFDAMASKLRAAGVQMSDTAETAPAHGLTVQKPTEKAGATPGDR
jgi:hypothetical protein